MPGMDSLSTDGILDVFTQEIRSHGGDVTEAITFNGQLFVRSVLPLADDIATGDRIRGGVAMRATDREIWVHPYTFRLVCTNGAIAAHAVESLHLENLTELGPDHAFGRLREAVRACGAPETFHTSMQDMQMARRELGTNIMINLLPMLARLPGSIATTMMQHIMQSFTEGRDRSLFGLMNAVTATAREQRDPELKWNLESLGGGVPKMKRPQVDSPRRAAAVRETVGV